MKPLSTPFPLAHVFHDRLQARNVCMELQRAGLSRSAITLLSLRTLHPDSFIRLNIQPAEESSLYAAIEAGATVLVVAASPESLPRIHNLLHTQRRNPSVALPPHQPLDATGDIDVPFNPNINPGYMAAPHLTPETSNRTRPAPRQQQ